MPIFEIQGPDGATYEVDAPDEASALKGFQGFSPSPAPRSGKHLSFEEGQALLDADERANSASGALGAGLTGLVDGVPIAGPMILGATQRAAAGLTSAIDGGSYEDRLTWTSPTTILTFTGIDGIAYAFGLFVIVGDAGKIATSPDGVTWTARTSGTSQFLYSVRLVNGVLMAVGSNGTILSSTDGINWTARTSGVTAILYDVTYGAGLYVVVGGGGVILTSANLSTWTPRTSGTSQDLSAVTYSTSGFLAVGGSGTARISTAGTSWAASITSTSTTFTSADFDPDNQAKYFAGANGALFVGLRTLPTQFQVPNDNPTYGWIKAVS